MSKISDVELRGSSQELIDFKDNVQELLNFGKYQAQVTSSVPTWPGRRGEHVWYVNGTDGRLYVSTTDESTTWTLALSFTV